METSFKLSRREKTDLILRYLRRCLGLFPLPWSAHASAWCSTP